jgi:hypothetical protein
VKLVRTERDYAEGQRLTAADGQQLTAEEQTEWVAYFDRDDAKDAVVMLTTGHSGHGWYVYCSEYPEEGSAFLGAELLSDLARARSVGDGGAADAAIAAVAASSGGDGRAR